MRLVVEKVQHASFPASMVGSGEEELVQAAGLGLPATMDQVPKWLSWERILEFEVYHNGKSRYDPSTLVRQISHSLPWKFSSCYL